MENPSNNYKIYVLLLEGGKYYVGKTHNMLSRLEWHKGGTCHWTHIYRPLDILEVRKMQGEFDEEMVTKEYMKRYGIENVRGGQYTQTILNEQQLAEILKSIESASNVCFKCGSSTHFASACNVNLVGCNKCGKVGNHVCTSDIAPIPVIVPAVHKSRTKQSKASKQSIDGQAITNAVLQAFNGIDVSPAGAQVVYTAKPYCVRCGRNNHYENTCRAKTYYKDPM